MTSFVPSPLPPKVSIQPRKLLTSGQPHRRVTHFPSLKNKEMVACESRWHARFCLHLEFEPKVVAYASRPLALQFAEAEVTARPDFAAILADGRQVYYHVSFSEEILDPRQQQRLSVVRECFGNNGLIFEHITPALYQATARTETLSFLYHHAYGASPAQAPFIKQLLQEKMQGRATIRNLAAHGVRVMDIAFAIFFQYIHTDLQQSVDLNTLVEAR
ncbi:hypothetical protein PS712_03340 [Pseudomonas fluorescens]|uniref:TnsA endonuclease N-terminal domain-containing protein n=1 Tax=Pseudomonas fluorescens TaxID=294 RepID=A0A5E7CXX8_PSEFL|nr:hypothetical protein [Pseudomonas fluorescens]VVO09506.1 hypothetical protein PS712_03340 [Pseudomonas fluorescens]